MPALILTLLPLTLVGLTAPALISVCMVLLSTRQPMQAALAFVGGAVGVLLVLGTLVLTLFDDVTHIPTPEIGRTLSVLLGMLMLLLALKSFIHAPDPDAPPPQWIERMESLTPGHALVLGILLVGTNLKVVAAYTFGMNQIIQAQVSLLSRLLAMILLLVLVLSGPLVPIGVYVVRPNAAARRLRDLKTWVMRASHTVLAVVLLVLGVYFLIREFMNLS